MSLPEIYIKKCIEKAKTSGADIPVGALVVYNDEIISMESNKRELENLVTAHAEILALNEASKKLKNWRLYDCDLYVTLEPCPMCAWAILNSRIRNVYFGAHDTKYGAFGGAINLLNIHSFKTKVFGGIMEKECEDLILEYFKTVRK